MEEAICTGAAKGLREQTEAHPVLHPTTQRVLDMLGTFSEKNGYAPSLHEIAGGCCLASPSVAGYHLRVLVRHGYITRIRGIARAIVLL